MHLSFGAGSRWSVGSQHGRSGRPFRLDSSRASDPPTLRLAGTRVKPKTQHVVVRSSLAPLHDVAVDRWGPGRGQLDPCCGRVRSGCGRGVDQAIGVVAPGRFPTPRRGASSAAVLGISLEHLSGCGRALARWRLGAAASAGRASPAPAARLAVAAPDMCAPGERWTASSWRRAAIGAANVPPQAWLGKNLRLNGDACGLEVGERSHGERMTRRVMGRG